MLISLVMFISLTTPALGGPSYFMHIENGGPEAFRSTPFGVDTTFTLSPSNGSGVFSGGGYAGQGYVGSRSRVDCTWGGDFSGAFFGYTYFSSTADDFIITGPSPDPIYVPGTLHVRVRMHFDRTGGFPGNNGHGGLFAMDATTPYAEAHGSLITGNYGASGSGIFSGVTTESVDLAIPLSGGFRTNIPFSMFLRAETRAYTYGHIYSSPGMSATEGGDVPVGPGFEGVYLESVNGQLMTLPAGYTLNSASWGISNNVGVADAPAVVGFRLELAGKNPTSGVSRLRLSLPHDSQVRVALYDIAGRQVCALSDGWQSAGDHDLTWDGRDAQGVVAGPGMYFAHARLGGLEITRRIVRVR
jgi:hypothetical protein